VEQLINRIKTAHGPKTRQSITFTGPGRTKQSHKNETDINQIMARFAKTGTIEFVNTQKPQFGDASGIEFQTAMQTVAKANEMFDALPSKIRERFNNNAQELLIFLETEENRTEAVFLGLLKEPEPVAQETKKEEPVKAPEASTEAAKGAAKA